MEIISVASDVSVGGTFLSWTLHWLAGHDTVFSYEQKQWLNIPSNPNNKTNAHKFSSNLMSGPERFYDMLGVLQDTDTAEFHHVYFHPFRNPNHGDSKVALDTLCNISNKVLVLEHQGKNQDLYWCKYAARTHTPKINNWNEYYSDWDEQHRDFVQAKLTNEQGKVIFDSFPESVWDYREFLALHWPQLVPPRLSSFFDYSQTHFLINTYDLFNSLDQHIHYIFEYLDLEINPSRLTDWQLVYQEWRNVHHDRMQFQTYFDTIVENIIHNRHMDLTRFNLDIVREAAIQHHLIKHHNLNLKTWQLTEFKNTQQLHALLEPSQHSI